MTLDLAILGAPTLLNSALSVNGTACSGVYKLLQRVMVLLFTDTDVLSNLGFGTKFPQDLIAANVATPEVAQASLNIACSRIVEQLSESADGLPDDERIDSLTATLEASTDKDTLSVEIVLITVASELKVTVPVSVLPAA